jgi:hypothetical protein
MRLGEKKPLQGMDTGWRGAAMLRKGKKLDRERCADTAGRFPDGRPLARESENGPG